MTRAAALAVTLVVAWAISACSENNDGDNTDVVTEPGVSLALARDRAARVSSLRYRLRFEIPALEQVEINAQAAITFELADAGRPLQLDFRAGAASIRSLRANGAAAAYEFSNEHVLLPASALRRGRNEIAIEFVAGDSALNRNPDYLYTLFVPDRARTAFPLFDQPDLKARFELTLVIPSSWRALSNAPVLAERDLGGQTEVTFAPTDRISSYLFSFVTGRFRSISRELDGRSMTMFHRETDEASVARNVDAIFELHAASIDWLEEYTGIEYPFSKFDFVLMPGAPYGGMEHVGAILYRAPSLLLEAEPAVTRELGRARLIAHETAHMWFGNLVTMRWFDDVWTKEVFANFMADKMVNPQFEQVDHALNFMVHHHPAAYAVDRSAGANPIRQPLPNLNQAGQLYGAIIYDKAPIMMRQLELLLGEEVLRQGLAHYLRRFSHGNASWPELVEILDAHSDVDVRAWSEVWVNTPGRPHFRLQAAGGGEQDTLVQEDPAGEGRVWPQVFTLLTLFRDDLVSTPLLADSRLTPVPSPLSGATASVFNADGSGYGLFPADLVPLQFWQRLQPVQRGAALINAWDNLLAGEIADPDAYFGLLLDIVSGEDNPLLLELALGQLQVLYTSLLGDGQKRLRSAVMEERLWATMLSQPDGGRTQLVFRYFAALASTPAGVQRLYGIWLGTVAPDRLILEEQDRIELAQTLAIRLPDKAPDIVKRQLALTENPDRLRQLEFIAPSLSADTAVRDAFFESLGDASNRQTESWVVAGLRNLHHPARLSQSEKYILPSLELLREVQVTGDIFFPSNWLQATLENHHSPSAAQIVRDFLAQRPDYDAQLRMKILQAGDLLFRAARLQREPSQ